MRRNWGSAASRLLGRPLSARPGPRQQGLLPLGGHRRRREINHGFLELLAIGRHAVPARLVFHEGNTFALHRVRDHHRGAADGRGGALEGSKDFAHVVPIDLQHVPPEGGVLVGEGIDIHHLADPAINLQIVLIDNRAQIIQLVMPGGHGGFPDAAFLLLAIPHDAVDAVGPAGEFPGQRVAHGYP